MRFIHEIQKLLEICTCISNITNMLEFSISDETLPRAGKEYDDSEWMRLLAIPHRLLTIKNNSLYNTAVGRPYAELSNAGL